MMKTSSLLSFIFAAAFFTSLGRSGATLETSSHFESLYNLSLNDPFIVDEGMSMEFLMASEIDRRMLFTSIKPGVAATRSRQPVANCGRKGYANCLPDRNGKVKASGNPYDRHRLNIH